MRQHPSECRHGIVATTVAVAVTVAVVVFAIVIVIIIMIIVVAVAVVLVLLMKQRQQQAEQQKGLTTKAKVELLKCLSQSQSSSDWTRGRGSACVKGGVRSATKSRIRRVQLSRTNCLGFCAQRVSKVVCLSALAVFGSSKLVAYFTASPPKMPNCAHTQTGQ